MFTIFLIEYVMYDSDYVVHNATRAKLRLAGQKN